MVIDPTVFNKATPFKIDYTTHIKLQKIALQHLGLTNINHIRDRFEGQAYYDNFLAKAYSELAFQKIFKEDVLKIENKIKKTYSPQFQISEKKIQIIYAKTNEYPIIPKTQFDVAVIIFVNLTTRETWIIGWIKYDDLITNTNNEGVSPLSEKHIHGYFTKLYLVKEIDSLFY